MGHDTFGPGRLQFDRPDDVPSFPQAASAAPIARSLSFWLRPLPWFALAVVLRLGYLQEQQLTSPLFDQPLLDEQEMAEAGRRLLNGEGFGPEPFFRAPLYPVVVGGAMAVGGAGWFWLLRFVQHLGGAALVLLVYDVTRRLLGPGPAGRLGGTIAAVGLALYGPLIRLEHLLALDFTLVFFQSVMLWSLIRMATARAGRLRLAWAALAGAAAGLAWLTRPTLTPLIPLLALWILGSTLRRPVRKPRRLRGWSLAAACFLVGPLVAIAAFGLRNRLVAGEGLLLPWQGGFNFYHANRMGASGRYFLQPVFALTEAGNPTRELTIAGYEAAVARAAAAPAGGGSRAIDAHWRRLAFEEIGRSPGAWLRLLGRKTLYLLNDREIYSFEVYEVEKGLSKLLRWLPFGFGWVWSAALASLAVWAQVPRGRRSLIALLWLYFVGFGGALALYYASGRMRMPLVFPAAALAASGLALMARGTTSSPKGVFRRWVFFCALALGGFVLSFADWWGVRSERLAHLEYARLSNAAWKRGEPGRALTFADRAEAELPGYPTVPLLRGQALYSLERIEESAAAFREALDRLPEDPVPPFNLGAIEYYDRGDPEGAEPWFAEALRRQPRYAPAAGMAALLSLGRGDVDGARRTLKPYVDRSPDGLPLAVLTALIALACRDGDAPLVDRRLAAYEARLGGATWRERLEAELARLGLTDCLSARVISTPSPPRG